MASNTQEPTQIKIIHSSRELHGIGRFSIAKPSYVTMNHTICKAALRLVFGLHQFDCHAEILFADCGLLPVSALISAAKLCWKVRLSNMSAERFPVAVDSITIPGQTDAAC